MKAKKILKTLAAISYGLVLLAQSSQKKTAPVSPQSETPLVDTKNLEAEIKGLTAQVKHWNNFGNRFALSLVTGVGTALGATVIATIVLLIIGPVLKAVGIDIALPN